MDSRQISERSSPDSSPCISGPSTPATHPDELFDDSSLLSSNEQFVLVTGGLGFIGSHTVLELLKSNYNVVIVDDLSNSFHSVFTRILTIANRHFHTLGTHCPKAEFHNLSYRDLPSMRALLESHCPSSLLPGTQRRSNILGIIHFAAYKAVEDRSTIR